MGPRCNSLQTTSRAASPWRTQSQAKLQDFAAAQEDRFKKLEVSITELVMQNEKCEGWFLHSERRFQRTLHKLPPLTPSLRPSKSTCQGSHRGLPQQQTALSRAQPFAHSNGYCGWRLNQFPCANLVSLRQPLHFSSLFLAMGKRTTGRS